MKRISAILLLFFFLISNSGMAISIHYCGGELASINFFSSQKNTCECSKKAVKKSCCKDKITILKAKIDNANITQFVINCHFSKNLFKSFSEVEVVPSIALQYNNIENYLPPKLKPKVPIYLWDMVFRI